MIDLNLFITNPFSDRWKIGFFKSGKITEHKAWEFNIYKTHTILGLGLRISHRTDHAGINIILGILGYDVEFQIYDVRHWNERNA